VTLAVEELAWSTTETPAPRHIAIIMDGNGRWAAERGLPRGEGHRQGVESVRRTVKAALELGITHLTLFSFSSENWARPKQEINDLFGLMRRFVRRDLADLHKNGVKIRIIGTRLGLDDDILHLIDDAAGLTKDNTALHLTIAFNYGARDDRPRRRAHRRGSGGRHARHGRHHA
jgi:undecaprenyl diphosphate synthase